MVAEERPSSLNLDVAASPSEPGIAAISSLLAETRYSWPVWLPAGIIAVKDEFAPRERGPDHLAGFELSFLKGAEGLFGDRSHRWRFDEAAGFGFTFRNQAWRLAFDYSDVLDASRFPEKGGQVFDLLFRFSLGKEAQLARLAFR